TVEPLGDAVTTNDEPFGFRRPPLAQAFVVKASGEVLNVVTNHFKSKGCGNASGKNADLGDGQGCWNEERRAAAATLAKWLATDPTRSNDPDWLIIGDLNAYAMEDPVRTLEEAGYVNLAPKFGGAKTYSYVYGGEF